MFFILINCNEFLYYFESFILFPAIFNIFEPKKSLKINFSFILENIKELIISRLLLKINLNKLEN